MSTPDGWRYRYKGGSWVVQKNKPHWWRPGMSDCELQPLFAGPTIPETPTPNTIHTPTEAQP